MVADDVVDKRVSEPRRMSARLRAKKDHLNVEKSSSDKERIASDCGVHSKRRRTSSIDPKEQPAAKKVRKSSNVSKATMRQIGRVAKSRIVSIIEGEERFLVHPDFRLQRQSRNDKILTSGIPRHDRNDMDDVLKNASYATDLFQHLYAAEVSRKHYIFSIQDIRRKLLTAKSPVDIPTNDVYEQPKGHQCKNESHPCRLVGRGSYEISTCTRNALPLHQHYRQILQACANKTIFSSVGWCNCTFNCL